MLTDGWKELRPTAEDGLDEFIGQLQTSHPLFLIAVNRYEIIRSEGDEG